MGDWKVGLVGCGHISVTHLKAWKKAAGCRVTGLFDRDSAMAERRAAKFGRPRVHETIEGLIDDVEIVDVCTPPQTHAAIARQVLEAGKYLVIEKPLVVDQAEWNELRALAEGAPDRITVVHSLKYARAVQRARSWVKKGDIGDVIRIQREFLTDPGTDRMLTAKDHWSHELPGGRWFETLPHELYLIYYFVGPLKLQSVTARRSESSLAGQADEVIVTLADERVLATIHFSARCSRNRRVFTVQGTAGRIEVDVLSDFASLHQVSDSRSIRALGRPVFDAAGTLLRAVPDRLSYFGRRMLGQSAHSRLIGAFARSLSNGEDGPTPWKEIEYVVNNCYEIGQAIDREVERVQAGETAEAAHRE